MKRDNLIVIIILGVILFGIFDGIGFLISWVDYFFNKSLIDMVHPWNLQWWHFLTYRHWWTWLFVNDFNAYLLYSAIVCIIIVVIIEIIVIGREWD